MTGVSEEQPQDTFSLFLRHMSNGDYPDADTQSNSINKKSERPNSCESGPFQRCARRAYSLALARRSSSSRLTPSIVSISDPGRYPASPYPSPFRSTRKPDSVPPSSFGFSVRAPLVLRLSFSIVGQARTPLTCALFLDASITSESFASVHGLRKPRNFGSSNPASF
jgi:hypothetical protein